MGSLLSMRRREGRPTASPDATPFSRRRGLASGRRESAWLLGVALALSTPGGPGVAHAAEPYLTTVHAPTPGGAPAGDPTAAVTTVTVPERPAGAIDLGGLLGEVPGATVTRYGGLGSFTAVSLRGSNPDEVRVYLDGVPLNEAVGGAVDLSKIPVGDVERIDVYRGSTPLGFGESAMGGVVAVRTRTPESPFARAQASWGSFGTWGGDLAGAAVAGPLRVYAGVHALTSEGDFPWQNPSGVVGGYDPGVRQNNDFFQGSGALRLVLTLPGRRHLAASALAFGQSQGVAGSSLNRVTSARDGVGRGLASLAYESRDDLGASSRLALTAYAGVTREHFQDRLAEIVGRPTELRDTTTSVGLRNEAEKAVGRWSRFLVLAEGRREVWSPSNAIAGGEQEPPASRLLGTLGAEGRFILGPTRILVVPSARLEAHQDRVTGRENISLAPSSRPVVSGLSPVWHLGLSRPLGNVWEVRANVGQYLRLPSFLELYGYDGRVIGDPSLSPERGLNADVGLAAQRESAEGPVVGGALTAFATRASDLIDWVGNSAGQIRPRNLSNARMLGLEGEGRLVWRGLRMTAQATWLDARDEGPVAASHDRLLPRRPQARGNGRIAWRQGVVDERLLVEVASDVDVTAGAYATPSNDVAMPARALWGAGLRVVHPASGLRVLASAANLLDWRGADFPGFPLPGRSFFLSLGWSSERGWQ